VPIFAYRCDACGHTFDTLQKLGADPLTDCPECGAAELKKLVSAPAFHLKGKGWRNSDDAPKKPETKPKFTHTIDTPTAHAEHGHSHGHSHDHGHSHSHSHDKKAEKKEKKSHSHDHGHSHGHSHGHKHDH